MTELKINRKELLNKLVLINQMNPDGNFLLSGSDDVLEFTTYAKTEIFRTKLRDEELFEFENDFSCLLPIKKLLQFCRLFQSDILKISIDNKKISMMEGKSRHTISLADVEAFPQVHNEVEFLELIFLNKQQLKMCLDFTNLSISKTDSAQFTLRAWNLILTPEMAQFSSCDGTQASLVKLFSSFDLSNSEELNITFSLESLKKISSFISESLDQVEISFSKTYTKFAYDDNELFINQAAATFPDVNKLFFDDENKTEFTLVPNDLVRAMSLVKLAENEAKSRLNFRLKDEELRVELKTSSGEGSESVKLSISDARERLFSLNDKNLSECLSKYSDKEITFRIFDNSRFPLSLFFNQDNMEFSLSMFLSVVDGS